MNIHGKYINRCIQLARNGLGTTYPNPLVGSVIVHDEMIIGEGWHKKAGGPHAEVNAINSVEDESLLKRATIYVSLEPCSHYGKTPPCSDLIIAKGIKKVVIGTVDPFAKVAGTGIKKLLEAGCEVKVGVLEKKCADLNKRFFTYHQNKRPYIILKWAKTGDNFIAPKFQPERQPVWITNSFSNQLVHKWRSEEQAILVGTNTAVADNPKLNTRLWFGENPVRVVLDKNFRIPEDSNLFDGSIKTIVLTSTDGLKSYSEPKIQDLHFEEVDFKQNIASQICRVLYDHNIQSLIVEGGRKTLETFINEGLWDEARIFTGKKTFQEGIPSPELSGVLQEEQFIKSDNLKIYRND